MGWNWYIFMWCCKLLSILSSDACRCKKVKNPLIQDSHFEMYFLQKIQKEKNYIHCHITYHSETWKQTSKCPAIVKLGKKHICLPKLLILGLSMCGAVSWANVKLNEKPNEGTKLNYVAGTAVQCGKRLKWTLNVAGIVPWGWRSRKSCFPCCVPDFHVILLY